MQSTPVVEPGHMLGVGLIGPFPKSPKQNEHLLVIVDYCPLLCVTKAPKIARILVEDILGYPDVSCI